MDDDLASQKKCVTQNIQIHCLVLLLFLQGSDVRPMTEVFPLEHVTEAFEQMMSGKARFRAVLNMEN